MSSNKRTLCTHLLVLALGWCLLSGPLAAQEAPLGTVDLPPSPILVNLVKATVRIVVDDTREPELRWWRERQDGTGSAELSVSHGEGSIIIERPASAEGEAVARLLVEIAIPAGQSMAVFGTGLDLTIERQLVEEPEESDPNAPPVAPTTPTTTEIQLVDSQATLSGTGRVTGTIDGSVVELHQTTGVHELTILDGELWIYSHRGQAILTAQGSEIMAEQTTGLFSVQATGGSVDLRSTRGTFKINARDAQIQVLDSRGPGIVSLTDSNLNLRGSNLQSLNLKGLSSHATMSNCDSTTTVDFTGGSLISDGGSGTLTTTARDTARIEFANHRGNIKLNLQQGSSADLREIRGDVNVTTLGGELTIDGASSLTLAANQAYATLSAISKLTSFQVTDSEIDLDLSDCRDRNPALSVRANSNVRVRLATPCRVQAKGVDASLASQIDVTGCELQLGRGGRWATRRVRGIDGQRIVTLTAQVAESAELRVEGRP